MKYITVLVFLVIAATVATYARYESFSPCDWLEHDMMQESGLPQLAVQTRIRASFLLDGVTEPTAAQCLNKWWTFRLDGLPAATN
jgi:hypothetical protein